MKVKLNKVNIELYEEQRQDLLKQLNEPNVIKYNAFNSDVELVFKSASVIIKNEDGKYNYLKSDGTFLSSEWFDNAYDFKDGFGRITNKKNEYNYLKNRWNIIIK